MRLNFSVTTRNLLTTLAVAGLVTSAAHAQSVTLIDTFAPGDGYSTNTGGAVNGANSQIPVITANTFTVTGSNVTLSSITVAMEIANPSATNANNFTLDLETSVPFSPGDPAQKPSGVSLETFNVVGRMANFGVQNAAITVTSVSHPLLQSGATYWVVASAPDPTTSAAWMAETISDTTPYGVAQLPSGGVWGYGVGHDAFRVTGLAAPEPSQTAALGLGIVSLAGLAFKARSRKQTA